jgi:hypothetical protein
MSGKHARRRPRWLYLVTGVVGVLGLIGALFLGPASPAGAVTPSPDACHVTNNSAPVGNCGAFVQRYRDSCNPGGVVASVPVGAFNHCAGDGNFKCSGLIAKNSDGSPKYRNGAHYYSTLGAYPNGWGDTANPSNHSNGNDRTFGGNYDPPTTTSVTSSSGDGVLRVRMWRSANGGSNHVAAPVPVRCMGLRYGKFTERLKISARTPGYKMAHLRYTPNEVDYPEAGGNFSTDPVSEFTHGFAESGADAAGNAAWTGWHTYSTEIVPGHVRFYYDGKLFKTVNADFPDAADWVLQNESALAGAYAAKGSSVTIDTSWLTCYEWSPQAP